MILRLLTHKTEYI